MYPSDLVPRRTLTKVSYLVQIRQRDIHVMKLKNFKKLCLDKKLY